MSTGPDRLPTTPDGRYFVHGGRLWRCTDPSLTEAERERLVHELMDARRAVGAAKRRGDTDAERSARDRVHRAKTALGERGPTWWGSDEVRDRQRPENTPYADWWVALSAEERARGT